MGEGEFGWARGNSQSTPCKLIHKIIVHQGLKVEKDYKNDELKKKK